MKRKNEKEKRRYGFGAYCTHTTDTSIPGFAKYGLNSNYQLYEHVIDFNSSTNLLNDYGMDLSTHCA
jgi:hypothetical protein